MPFGKGPGCVFPHGVRICRATFLKLHGVGKYNVIVMCNRGIDLSRKRQIYSPQNSVGLTNRQHGNHNRLPHNALSFVETKNVVRIMQK